MAPTKCEMLDCKKKLNLTSFACRCGLFYCNNHRSSEEHKCQFDYKKFQENELNKYMSSPVICGKLEKM